MGLHLAYVVLTHLSTHSSLGYACAPAGKTIKPVGVQYTGPVKGVTQTTLLKKVSVQCPTHT